MFLSISTFIILFLENKRESKQEAELVSHTSQKNNLRNGGGKNRNSDRVFRFQLKFFVFLQKGTNYHARTWVKIVKLIALEFKALNALKEGKLFNFEYFLKSIC